MFSAPQNKVQKSTDTSKRMFTYWASNGFVWLIFVALGNQILRFIPKNVEDFLVNLAQSFPSSNGRYLSLVDRGYEKVALVYSVYFSINLILFLGFTLFMLIKISVDNEFHSKCRNIKIVHIFFGLLVCVWFLFFASFIDYGHDRALVNYEIHKGALYFYLDNLFWILTSALLVVSWSIGCWRVRSI